MHLRPHPTKALLVKLMSQGLDCTLCRCRRLENDMDRNWLIYFINRSEHRAYWCSVVRWAVENAHRRGGGFEEARKAN